MVAPISGINKLVKAIDDLRRNDGSVAHGKDAFVDAIAPDALRAFVVATDAIVATILSAYDGEDPSILTTREPISRWKHLNERINAAAQLEVDIDEESGKLTVRIYFPYLEAPVEMQLTPAELLYELYRAAYVEVIEAMRLLPMEKEEAEPGIEAEAEEAEVATEEEPAAPPEPTPEPSRLQLLDEYQGRYQVASPKRRRVIINIMPSTRCWHRHWSPAASRPEQMFPMLDSLRRKTQTRSKLPNRKRNMEIGSAVVVPASYGIHKGREKAFPWCFTPAKSSAIRR